MSDTDRYLIEGDMRHDGEEPKPRKPTEEVLSQIEKLLRVTTDKGASVTEAEMAAKRAQKLMFEYNISADALNKKDASAVGEYEVKRKGGVRYGWSTGLLDGLCKTNFCRVFGYWHYEEYERGKGETWRATIIGQPNDAQLVLYLYSYLFNALRKLGYREFATGDYPWIGHSNTFMKDWGRGAVDGVLEQLKAQRAASEQEAPEGSMALVVARDQMVTDYIFRKEHDGLDQAQYKALQQARSTIYREALAAGEAGAEYDKDPVIARLCDELAGLGLDVAKLDVAGELTGYANAAYGTGVGRREDAEQEARYASGELPRPKTRTVRTRLSSRSYGPGRKEHQTDRDIYTSGLRTGRKIQINPGIEQTSTTGTGTRRLG